MICRRDRLQRIAGLGRYRKAAVPQFDRNAGRNEKAQRLTAFGDRTGRPDLAGQYLLNVRELVEIDVNNFGAVLQVEAGVVTMEAADRREVAAAQDIGGLVEVDVAADIRRHAMGKAVRIVGDEQANRDMRSPEALSKFHRGIATYGMADNSDWLGVAAVVADRLIGDTAPHEVGTDVRRDAGAVDALRQLIHPPIDKVDHATEQIGAPVRLGRLSLGGGAGEACCDQDGGDLSGLNHFDKANYDGQNSRPTAIPAGIPLRDSLDKQPPDHEPRIFRSNSIPAIKVKAGVGNIFVVRFAQREFFPKLNCLQISTYSPMRVR